MLSLPLHGTMYLGNSLTNNINQENKHTSEIEKHYKKERKIPFIKLWYRKRLVTMEPGWSELAVIETPSSC